MKITMLASISGLRDGKAWPPRGGQVTVPDDEAQDLIDGGLAKKYEKADASPDDEPEVKGPDIPVPEDIGNTESAKPAQSTPRRQTRRSAKKTAAKKAAAKKAAAKKPAATATGDETGDSADDQA